MRPKTVQRSQAAPLRKIKQAVPILLPEMEEAALDALRNDRALAGENVLKFEEEFASMVGTKHAVSTNSGTAALAFILIALGAEKKKYVTTTWSFVASSNSIIHAGGEPVFADISEEDYCMDPVDTEKLLKQEKKISGILPVHIYGQPIDFDSFQEIADEFMVPIVEDAAQAHAAKYKGHRVGSLGTAAAFSFYPSKNMTVLGDGGMVTTNDEKIASIVSKLRNSGRVSQYKMDILGYTARLNTVSAAIGRVQLKHLDEWNERRRQIARKYASRLKDIAELPPLPRNGVEPVFHQFVIRVKKRDDLKTFLEKRGIEVGVHYPIPIHLQPLYVARYGYKKGSFSKSEKLAEECLSLPMHPLLSDEDANFVCEQIRSFYDHRV